jgi:hypothetical protein
MADPLAVVIRFKGDVEELSEACERLRRAWIDAQDGDYDRPLFYAVCRTREGIEILSAWSTTAAHRAFGQGLHTGIEAAGMPMPDEIERMPIVKLGWD